MKAVAAAAAAVAVALFLPLEFPVGEGQAQQQAAFEYEVLSGLLPQTGNTVLYRRTSSWHGPQSSIDLIYDGGDTVLSRVDLLVRSVRTDTAGISAKITGHGYVDGS